MLSDGRKQLERGVGLPGQNCDARISLRARIRQVGIAQALGDAQQPCEHEASVVDAGDGPHCVQCGQRVRTPGPDERPPRRSGNRAMWVTDEEVQS